MELDRLRRQLAIALLATLWAFVPLAFATGLLAGSPAVAGAAIAALGAGACTPLVLRAPGGAATRLALAVALIAAISVLVWLAPTSLRIDMHMCYFAALAALAGFCDRRVILAGLAAIATHHIALNFLLPTALFPSQADFPRVLLHAAVAAIEAGLLIWVVQQIEAALGLARAATAAATAAREATEAEAARRLAAEAGASAHRREGRIALATRIEAGLSEVAIDIGAAGTELESTTGRITEAAQAAEAAAATAGESVAAAGTDVDAVARAAEDLAATAAAIGTEVDRAAAATARAVAETRATDATVQELAGTAQRISDVVQLISGVAGQTNLLALNATIEAARAGEAGKGFAVVASEVKALATQTARATEEISEQVSTIRTRTEAAVRAIGGIRSVVAELEAASTAIAGALDAQCGATASIAASAGSMTGAMQRVDTAVRHSAGGIGAASEAVADLDATARRLSRDGTRLQGELASMLTELRAG